MAITTAKGTIVNLGNAASPSSYAAIGQIRSITGSTTKADIVDITTHDTAGNAHKKLAVLVDYGDFSFEINFDKADATHAFTTGLWSLLVALTKRGYQCIFPNSAGTMLFDAYVNQHEFNAPVNNVLGAKIMLTITDALSAS